MDFKKYCHHHDEQYRRIPHWSERENRLCQAEEDSSGYEHMKENMMEELKRSFRPEFLNRIDDIIVFHKLDEEDTLKIADLMLKSIAERLSERNIHLSYTREAVEKLAKQGFDEEYGARPLRRLMQQTVEDKLSEEILEGNVKLGDRVKMEVADGEIVFRPEAAGARARKKKKWKLQNSKRQKKAGQFACFSFSFKAVFSGRYGLLIR